MDAEKLFRPSEIRRLSKDETIALYKRHMLEQNARAEAAEARVKELEEALRGTSMQQDPSDWSLCWCVNAFDGKHRPNCVRARAALATQVEADESYADIPGSGQRGC